MSSIGVGLVYSCLSNEQCTKTISLTNSSITRQRLNRAYFSSTLNFEAWADCAEIIKEPKEGYWAAIVGSFRRKILFYYQEFESNEMEPSLRVSAIDASFVKIQGGSPLCFLHQDTFPTLHQHFLDFLRDV